MFAVFNVGVVFWHWSNAPHPKFMMLWSRILSIRVHMISGTFHIISSVTAIVLHLFHNKQDLEFYGQIQAIAAVFHIASALYQTPIVFGAKGIMHPSYYMVIAMHAYFALQTWYDPGNYTNILRVYQTLCIFTYCRIYMLLFFRNNYLAGNEYTISILLAGLTIFPFIGGPAGITIFIFAHALNLELIRIWNNVNEFNPAFQKLLEESNRHQIVDPSAHLKFTGIADFNAVSQKENKKAARAAFDSIDKDRSGFIDQEEVDTLTKSWSITPAVLSQLHSTMRKSGNKLSFEQFYRSIWNISAINKPSEPPSSAKTEHEKAKMVFDTIDVDGSGHIELAELASVLVQWGCPDSEVTSYLHKFDSNGDGVFDSEEFYTNFKPVWKYGHHIMCHDEWRANMISEAELKFNKLD